MLDTAAAVLFGNILTIIFAWSLIQFHRFDYKAPWLAYVAFLMPMAYLAISVLLTEGLPPHLDAIALR